MRPAGATAFFGLTGRNLRFIAKAGSSPVAERKKDAMVDAVIDRPTKLAQTSRESDDSIADSIANSIAYSPVVAEDRSSACADASPSETPRVLRKERGARRLSARVRWSGRTPYLFVVALIATLVVGVAALAAWQEKQRYRERATVATQNIASQLDQQLSAAFDKIDGAVLTISYYFNEMSDRGEVERGKLHSLLVQQQSLLPDGVSLRILDKNGAVRFAKGFPAADSALRGDPQCALGARQASNSGLVVAGPYFSRAHQEWSIVFSRRLEAADGSVVGSVCATYPTAQFEKILSSVSLGPKGAATIRTSDLALVHRWYRKDSPVGSRDVSTQLRGLLQTAQPNGAYIGKTALDGIERSNAYRKLQRYPFYLIVGLATEDYLDGWKTNVLMLSGLAALAIAVTLLAACLVYRNAQRLETELVERKRLDDELDRHRNHLQDLVQERTRALAEANDRLEVLSYSDGLTGIANRRKFDHALAHEWRRAQRMRTPLALIIIDVDFFKAYNDRYGHLAGDGCLQALARLLAQAGRRAGELVARYGGEEFVVLLPDTRPDEALGVARAVQQAVWSLALPHDESATGSVTVSLGVACMVPVRPEVPEEIVRQADSALYRAKQAGRNCIECAT